jgi:hypothetical protein
MLYDGDGQKCEWECKKGFALPSLIYVAHTAEIMNSRKMVEERFRY